MDKYNYRDDYFKTKDCLENWKEWCSKNGWTVSYTTSIVKEDYYIIMDRNGIVEIGRDKPMSMWDKINNWLNSPSPI